MSHIWICRVQAQWSGYQIEWTIILIENLLLIRKELLYKSYGKDKDRMMKLSIQDSKFQIEDSQYQIPIPNLNIQLSKE